jgi:uncharacterized protein (TIGR02271 family)
MAKTVVGMFDDFHHAQAAVGDLTAMGISRDDISVARKGGDGGDTGSTSGSNVAGGAAAGAATGAVIGGAAGLAMALIPGLNILAAGPLAAALTGMGVGAAAGGLVGGLTGAGVPEEEAHYYNEGVNRGGTLVTLRTSDELANPAAEVLNRHGAIDIDERARGWQSAGWRPGVAGAAGTGASGATTTTASTMGGAAGATGAAPATPQPVHGDVGRSDVGRGERADWDVDESGRTRVPVVEERLEVGKREVRGGGVRVYSHLAERAVNEDVTLRDEKVNLERRPVDRPVTDADLRAETIEVTESREVPVVAKQARVVEEIVLNKEVEQRQETIHDTVRKTDVRVEQIPPGGVETRAGFATDPDFRDDDYRDNYNSTYASSGVSFDQARPAYLYGSQLARDQRYAGRDWSAIESDARRDWDARGGGGESTWEKMKDGVRHAYDRARRTMRT